MRARRPQFPIGVALLFGAAAACTNAGIYAVDGSGPGRPDRAAFEGIACVPPAQGDAFPTKILFAVQGGEGVQQDVKAVVTDALDQVAAQYSLPHIRYALVAFHSVATGLLGGFSDGTAFQAAVQRYAGYQEQGPISVRAPLRLARSILSGDMLSSCQGTVGRSRYLVVLLVMSPDTSCSNPTFNADIDPACAALAPDQCSLCELTNVVASISNLVDTRGAGEVAVQPIYVRQNTIGDAGFIEDPAVVEQIATIAQVGGTTPRVVDASQLPAVLLGLNYASIQRQLVRKELFAFNRNAIARGGEELTDTDGDGIADVDEVDGLDPLRADTDGDYLMDGLERRMGMNPLVPDTLTACNPLVDTDGDRLNDCEERVLGTNACMGDTDGDAIPDLVEGLMGTNPLVPEDLQDDDGDGATNLEELRLHSDPKTGDGAFRAEHGYGYDIQPADPTVDGRLCYQIRVTNIGLRATQQRPDTPYPDIPAGSNDVYLYFLSGRANDPHGASVSAIRVQRVVFTPPSSREPSGLIPIDASEFNAGL